MSAKKTNDLLRYISVEGVPNKLLDFMLALRFKKHELLAAAAVDPKMKRKVAVDDVEQMAQYKVHAYFSTVTFSFFPFYTALIKFVQQHLQAEGDALYSAITDGDVLQNLTTEFEKIEKQTEQISFFQKYIELFRFYKKGKYANEYVPVVYRYMQDVLPAFAALFLEEDEPMIEKLSVFIEEKIELEREQAPEPASSSGELTATQFKEEMLALVERFTAQQDGVSAEEVAQLEQQLASQEAELKQVQKQLKSKDELVSKLQKQLAAKEKEAAAATAKVTELKRVESAKTQEASLFKKQAEEAVQKLQQLEARHETTRQTYQKELAKAREEAAKPLQIKLNELEEQLEDAAELTASNMKKLEEAAFTMQKSLAEEREQREQLEDELARLRQFQQLYVANNEQSQQLRLQNETLQQEQQAFKQKIAQLEQQLADATKQAVVAQASPAFTAPPAVAPLGDAPVELDEDLFAQIMNAPVDEEEVAVGTIQVVKDENEIDFDELFSNKPE